MASAKDHRLRRISPHGDARGTSAKRQGGPDPPETKVGVSFLNRAATIEREGQCPLWPQWRSFTVWQHLCWKISRLGVFTFGRP